MAGREEDLESELKALRRRVEEFEKASSEEAEKFRTLTVFSPVGFAGPLRLLHQPVELALVQRRPAEEAAPGSSLRGDCPCFVRIFEKATTFRFVGSWAT